MMSDKPNLLVLVGPTATGKSAAAVRIARALGGEVVSADSMQVYRHFDIGTGKLPLAERCGVPHHLIDVVEPTDRFSAAEFTRRADHAIGQIVRAGRLPVVVGGTGLYVRALLHGLFDSPEADPAIRAAHDRIAHDQGTPALHARLAAVDPDAAAHININDRIRISRALEVFEQTGAPVSHLRRTHAFGDQRYDALLIGLRLDPDGLRQRIDRRVDQMMAAGWLDEVRRLCRAGYTHTHPMGALGYRQLAACLAGGLDLDQAVGETKRETWRFSRRQRNWFAHEPGIRWVDESTLLDPHLVQELLQRKCDGGTTGGSTHARI